MSDNDIDYVRIKNHAIELAGIIIEECHRVRQQTPGRKHLSTVIMCDLLLPGYTKTVRENIPDA